MFLVVVMTLKSSGFQQSSLKQRSPDGPMCSATPVNAEMTLL